MKRYFITALLIASATVASAKIIETFENIPNVTIWDADATDRTGNFFSYDATRPPLAVVDNPNKSGINTSDKVVSVQVFAGGANSGILRINFVGGTTTAEPLVTYPACPTCTNERFDRLRFKYYKGYLLNRYVELEPNGSPSSPKKLVQAQEMGDWEYITFEIENKTYNNFQIRVNRNDTGTGSAVGTADGDFIYVDDFEFYNSEDGVDFPPTTDIQSAKVEKDITCLALGGNQFNLKTNLEQAANVRVELITISGRSTTLYDNVAEGHLEVPFSVTNRGVYLVRTTIDNTTSETIKIIY